MTAATIEDTSAVQYAFGDFELNADTRRIHGPDGPVHVEPQVFDVLHYLIEHRGRVVSKEELLDEIWGSRFVSESALTSRIKAARSAVGDSGRAQSVIRTAHGTGYQFVASVEGEGSDAAIRRDLAASGRSRAAAVTRHLPVANNELRGRTRERNDLLELITDERLITVLGTGGTGKTRLAIETAGTLPADEAVVFVDLAAVRDDRALGMELAASLGIESGAEDDVVAACVTYLRARPTLVLLDNCEHVADAATELARRLLSDAPMVTILATSRVPLGLTDEVLYRLRPLPILVATEETSVEAAAQNAAIALFCDRARRVQQDFELTADLLPDVSALCSSLDGLPLALELAAGRMGAFSVADLVARLDRRLDLLGDDRSDASARHRTLRATLTWSYDLLAGPHQRLFRFLSVFPAGLTLDGIEWLGERIELDHDPVLALSGLVEASLIGRTESPSGTRYVQLETMRTYGTDLLAASDEHEAARDLVAAWALHTVSLMNNELRSEREAHWDDRIRREIPNIREGRNRLHERERYDDLLTISCDLDEWARLRDVSEVWTWCDELAVLPLDHSAARVAAVRALAAWRRGQLEEARSFAELGIAAADGDAWSLARAKSSLGVVLLFSGEFQAAAREWEERDELDGYFLDGTNAILCIAYAGEPGAAQAAIDGVRHAIEAEGWPTGSHWLDYVTGEIAALAGDAQSIQWLESAIAGARAVGSAFTVGVAGVTLCTEMAARGDEAGAAARYSELIEHWLRSGTWTQLWTTLRNAAALLADHDPALARQIMTSAAADPAAAGLDPQAETAAAELVTRLENLLGPEDGLRRIDRAELAEQARQVLAAVAAG